MALHSADGAAFRGRLSSYAAALVRHRAKTLCDALDRACFHESPRCTCSVLFGCKKKIRPRDTSPPTNSPSGGTFLVWTRLFRPLGAGGAPLFRRRRAAPRGARLFCPRSGFFHPKVRFLQLFAGERGGDKRLHGKLRPATFRSEQRPQFKLYTQCANIAQPDS